MRPQPELLPQAEWQPVSQDISNHRPVIKSNHLQQVSYQNLPSCFNSRLIKGQHGKINIKNYQKREGKVFMTAYKITVCPWPEHYLLTYSRKLEKMQEGVITTIRTYGSASTQGATIWPGPFGRQRFQWWELRLRSKQILSGLNKEKETATCCLFSHERKGAPIVTLTCWSKQKGSDSPCRLWNFLLQDTADSKDSLGIKKTIQQLNGRKFHNVYWKQNTPFSAQETLSCRSISGKDQHTHACSTLL